MLLERSNPLPLKSRILFDLRTGTLVGGFWRIPANPQRHSLIILQNANNQLEINGIFATVNSFFGAGVNSYVFTWDDWGEEVTKSFRGDNVSGATVLQVIEQYIDSEPLRS